MKMVVPAEVARKHGWLPGQRFVGKIILLQADKGYSVPNVALGNADGKPNVQVLDGGKVVTRTLKLGVRGATRTQVLEGLQPGDRVLLGKTDAVEAP